MVENETLTPSPIRVMVVDDHAVVRGGLTTFLLAYDDLELVGEAANGAEALTAAERCRPDVVLMDLMMPEMDGATATRLLREKHPDIQVIALTSFKEDDLVQGVLAAGAIGYLLKNTEGNELRRAVRAAALGQVQLSPEAAARLMEGLRQPVQSESLTDRETEVLKLVAAGMSNKEIAAALTIAERTVKTHVSSIMGKLDVQSRTQAALYAVRAGIVSAPK